MAEIEESSEKLLGSVVLLVSYFSCLSWTFMVQQKSPSIFSLEGWDSEYEFTTQIFFGSRVFLFQNPMARVQADSHFGAGRFIVYSTGFWCGGTIGHWGIYSICNFLNFLNLQRKPTCQKSSSNLTPLKTNECIPENPIIWWISAMFSKSGLDCMWHWVASQWRLDWWNRTKGQNERLPNKIRRDTLWNGGVWNSKTWFQMYPVTSSDFKVFVLY